MPRSKTQFYVLRLQPHVWNIFEGAPKILAQHRNMPLGLRRSKLKMMMMIDEHSNEQLVR
jgi:hypothetical protein